MTNDNLQKEYYHKRKEILECLKKQIRMDVSKYLKENIKSFKIKKTYLCREADISMDSLERYVNGKSSISLETLIILKLTMRVISEKCYKTYYSLSDHLQFKINLFDGKAFGDESLNLDCQFQFLTPYECVERELEKYFKSIKLFESVNEYHLRRDEAIYSILSFLFEQIASDNGISELIKFAFEGICKSFKEDVSLYSALVDLELPDPSYSVEDSNSIEND